MRAYAMKKIGEVGWIEKERPSCGALDAIVKPLAVAPCTSDYHTVFEGGVGERTNMVLGHEACGVIDEVGSLVKDFKPGDKVLVNAITPDWNTIASQEGYSMHCNGPLTGWKFSNIKDGVFAEYFHVNDADGNLAHMPDSMGYDEACMLSDMVPTGFHAAELAEIQYGDVVAVIGLGPVGLMALAAANLGGAGKIIAIDSRPLVWNIAKGYGADYIVDYKKAPTVDQVMDITHGKGVDKVLVAGGNTHIFETALNILRPGGIVANVNYFGSGDFITIPREAWGAGMCHKDIRGGLMPGGRARLTKLSRLIETGRLDVKPLITHHLKGFDSIPEALDLMNKKPEGLLKPVVVI